MEFHELIEECDEIRRKTPTRTSVPNFNYRQGFYKGKTFVYYRHRTVELILYLDNDRHYEILKRINSMGYTYACILHDSDLLDKETEREDVRNGDNIGENFDENELKGDDKETFDAGEIINTEETMTYDGIHKKPHIHVILYFTNPRTNTAVAKTLGHDSNLTWVHSNLNSRLLYLTHRDHVDKYQYSPNRIVGNMACRMPQLHTEYGRRSSDLLNDILLRIKNTRYDKTIRFTQLALDMLKDGYDSLLISKYQGVIKECIYEHNSYAKWVQENHWIKRPENQSPFIEV